MSVRFHQARPLQAGKLASIVVAVPIGAAVIYGVVPYPGVLGLFLVPLLGIGLAVVVMAETLFAGVRALRDDAPATERLTRRPVYGAVRAVEVVAPILATAVLWFVLASIPDGPMAGPGAMGLWMIVVGLALVVVAGCLLRTLAEVYYHRAGATT